VACSAVVLAVPSGPAFRIGFGRPPADMDELLPAFEDSPGSRPVRIAVVGAGHVGLVSAACLAAVGHRVAVQDVDAERIRVLSTGRSPFLEPGLDDLLSREAGSGRLSFHTSPAAALAGAQVAFVCVGTPNGPGGRVDLSFVLAATEAVLEHAPAGCVLVNRSTAPVGTASYLRSLASEARGDEISVAVNPEFLAEGTAVRDFLSPDRVVVGAWDRGPVDALLAVYEAILSGLLPLDLEGPVADRAGHRERVPVVATDPSTAELIKYAANAFLAVKISFINEIAAIAEEVGGDVTQVARGIGLDRRIGPHFLRAGIGWGGSCFPKDIVALQGMAETRGLSARILRAANDVNRDQHRWVVSRLQRHLKTLVGRRIGLLGLAFKANTDDLRSAPSLEIAAELVRLGARVRAYDPSVKALPPELEDEVDLAPDATALANGAEALVLVTEWPEFAQLDLPRLAASMRVPLLLDGRNVFDPSAARAAGFTYDGVGRDGHHTPEPHALPLAEIALPVR
jgi:UDPglucose 6-dehydrogenase